MSHPLVARLTAELGWPLLSTPADLAAYAEAPGTHCVFVPGEADRNLETPDVAVILPELRQAFQGRFDCAVATGGAEEAAKAAAGAHKTPSLVFFRAGRCLGALPKVRDWGDYMARIPQILGLAAA